MKPTICPGFFAQTGNSTHGLAEAAYSILVIFRFIGRTTEI